MRAMTIELIIGLSLAYSIGLILVAAKFRKIGTKSLYDFFLTGKRLPLWVVGLALAATLIGVGDLVGQTGFTWEVGVSAINFLFAGAVGAILSGLIIGPIWASSKELTLPAWLYTKLQSRVLSLLISINMIIFGIMAVGLISLGFAKVLAYIGGMPVTLMVFLCVLVIIIYASIGGQLGVSYNDVIMMITMWIFLIPVVYFSLTAHGGISGLLTKVHAIDPAYLDFWKGIAPLTLLNLWIAGMFHYFGFQVNYQKIASGKNMRAATFGPVLTGIQLLIFPVLIALVGLASIPLVRSLSNPDYVILWFSENVMGEWILPLMYLFILAAALSTGSSFLLGTSNNIVNDFIKVFKPSTSEKRLISLSRILLLVIGIGGVYFALTMESVFFGLVWTMTIGVSISPVILAAAWWKEGGKLGHIAKTGKPYITKNAAIASVIVGMGTAILSGYIPEIDPIFGGGAVFSFSFSILTLLIATAVEKTIKHRMA